MMRQSFFKVVSNKADKVGRINIYGVIGDYWSESNTASSFERAFRNMEDQHDRIDIYINSPGGSIWDGLPIFNAIKSSAKEVHTYVSGIAFSMGFMILLSAKSGRRHAFKGSLGMAHNASQFDYGNAKKLRKSADDLDKYDEVLGGLIAECTGKTLDQVKADWLDYEDHYFTPEEMKAEGFINHIEQDEAEDMPENVRNLSMNQVAAYYRERMEEPSQSLIDKVFNKISGMIPGNTSQQSDTMFGNKFPKMKALAKVAAASHTAEAIEAANTEIAENEIEGVTLVLDSELEEAEANVKKIKDLEKTIADLQKEIKAYKEKEKKPAAEAASPATDKPDDNPGSEAKDVLNFETTADKELKSMMG